MDQTNIELPTRLMDAMVIIDVADELARARGLHEPMKSAHEAYSVILEEIDEFWDEVKKKRNLRNKDAMYKELVQISAMAIRAARDLNLVSSR